MKTLEDLLKEYRADFGEKVVQNTLPGLYDLIQYVQKALKKKDLNVIEIGCLDGISTELFAMTCGEVHAVDGWDLSITENNYAGISKERLIEAEERFHKRLRGYTNVYVNKFISEEAHKYFKNGKYDLVYIDGDHTEKACYNDIIWWKPKIKEGGFISGHDYNNIYTVRNAVAAAFDKPDKIFKDHSWLKCI